MDELAQCTEGLRQVQNVIILIDGKPSKVLADDTKCNYMRLYSEKKMSHHLDFRGPLIRAVLKYMFMYNIMEGIDVNHLKLII